MIPHLPRTKSFLLATLCGLPLLSPAQGTNTGFRLSPHDEHVFVMEQNQSTLIQGRELGRIRVRDFVDGKTATRDAAPQPEVAGARRVYRYEGLTITQETQLRGQRVDIRLEVSNHSANPLVGIQNLVLAEVNFPSEPKGPGWWGDRRGNGSTSLDDVAFLYARFGTGTLGIWNASYDRIVRLNLGRVGKEGWKYQLSINTAPTRIKETNDPMLMPGETRTYHIVLGAAAGEIDTNVVAREAYQAFGEMYPQQLNWPDRRPIGFAILASSHKPHQSATNPRGWFNNPKLDVFSEAGKVHFREEAMKFADRVIAGAKRIDAQGVIIWDIEGAENPHPITYIGDPRLLQDFAPEMEEIADEFFKRIRDQGLRVGVCIRPSRVRQRDDGSWVHRNMGYNRVELLNEKIIYAKERWGATLFYMDTNVAWVFDEERTPRSYIMLAEEFEQLNRLHPDVLIIPEFGTTRHLASTAPYEELRAHTFGNTAQTSPVRRVAYPRGFSIVKIENGDQEGRYNDLVNGVRNGDSLLIATWYTMKDQDAANRIYKEAAEEPKP